MSHLELRNYTITWDRTSDLKGTPKTLLPHLKKIHKKLPKPTTKTLKRLHKLIREYPEVPELRNYLTVAYQNLGDMQKAEQTNDDLFEEYPNYFFARANKAHFYERKNEFEKIEALMGKGFDLKNLYPDRDVFHITEFLTMQGLAVAYYAGIGEMGQAKERLQVMTDSPNVKMAEEKLQYRMMSVFQQRIEEERKLEISPKNTFSSENKSFTLPPFNYEETLDLLNENFGENQEIIQKYLELDREKLIEDLENLLRDHFYNYPEKQDEYGSAPIHALVILSELEAEESLPILLKMMGQSKAYFDATFDYLFNDYGWMVLYNLGKNRLPVLEDYLKQPGKYLYFRTAVSNTLFQLYLHFTEKRDAITGIYERLLNFYNQAKLEDNIIDNKFIGFLISDLLDLKLNRFLPEIESLYEKGYVHPSICGSYEEVEKDMKKRKDRSLANKRNILTLFEIYGKYGVSAGEMTFGIEEMLQELTKDKGQNEFYSDKETRQKVGRNDPYPCGSGKKFKKCCLGKGIYD